MNKQSIVAQICKTIICIAIIITWAYIFGLLAIIGPPIWGVLLLIATTICLITYFSNSKKYKNLNRRMKELEEENKKLRQELAEQAVRHAMDKAEGREKRG